ncbi:MAG: hypothetical protein A2580_15285 [Hydrogenophilales bacterium RIFOXYD1_FULL_62_11]|nr:MAG: hypothetical protein A2580_15285 [Hydrogenophilales bacterium RIFOXYD1_FULL_62_11]
MRALLVALMLTLAGCATPVRLPDHPPDLAPPVHVPESTWWEVDSDIGAASLAAKASARDEARGAMANWKRRIQKRTETDFIPWFTDFWTQQWLAMKVAWYKLSAEEGADPTIKRLSAYLQTQYRERVLDPVAREIDPDKVRALATNHYAQRLSAQLQEIPRRYGVPVDQFDRRIKAIPAIALTHQPAHSASLYEVVHAEPIATLPAYVALSIQVRKDSGTTGNGPSDARISPVAKRASEILAARLITSGGASAAAAAIGGGAGVIISFGTAGFSAIAHEKDRPKMEAQLRESLRLALADMWLELVEDPATGVMAEVYHLSGQIEGGLVKTLTQPAPFEPAPQGTPLRNEKSDNEGLSAKGRSDK